MIISNRCAGLITMSLGLEAGSGAFVTMMPFSLFPAIKIKYADVGGGHTYPAGTRDEFQPYKDPVWVGERNIDLVLHVNGERIDKSYFLSPTRPSLMADSFENIPLFSIHVSELQTTLQDIVIDITKVKSSK